MQDNPKVNRLGRRKAIIAWEFEHAKVDICVGTPNSDNR